MDPNNLAVNSVISSHLTFPFAWGARLYAAIPSLLEEVRYDDAVRSRLEARFKVLTNLNIASRQCRTSVDHKRWGHV